TTSSLTPFFSRIRPPPRPTLFPYTTLFRSNGAAGRDDERIRHVVGDHQHRCAGQHPDQLGQHPGGVRGLGGRGMAVLEQRSALRSEEHTSELQSRFDLVCRLLLEKKKQQTI